MLIFAVPIIRGHGDVEEALWMTKVIFQIIRYLVQDRRHRLHQRIRFLGLAEQVQWILAVLIRDAPDELRPRCEVYFVLAEFDNLGLDGSQEFFGSSA